MSFSDKGSTDDAEVLVNTLALGQPNLSALSTSDYHTLTELSEELTLTTDMETDEQEIIIESQEEIEHEEVIQTEIDPQEIEIEAEEPRMSPEKYVHAVKVAKGVGMPPLRPLTIAPKPKQIPIAMKPLAGQPVLLLQGASGGQAIKLVSSQGQELNFSNLQISRPLAFKPAIKTLTTQAGNLLVQPKPVVMKKIIPTGTVTKTITKPLTLSGKQAPQYMVMQKTGDNQVKLVQQNAPKTITLQQAQEMGLLTSKVIPQGSSGGKQTVLINKAQPKTIKLLPQGTAQVLGASGKTITLNQLKSPTKILPATSIAGNVTKVPQRIIFKPASGNQTVIPTGQLMQVSSGSQGLNMGQIHQINIPGKAPQYIKFVTANPVETNSSPPTSNNIASTANTVQEIKPLVTSISKIAPKPITISAPISTSTTSTSSPQLMVIPAPKPAMQPIQPGPNPKKVAIPALKPNLTFVPKPPVPKKEEPTSPTGEAPDPNGMRPRKPCNCNRSQCLKLYCDCFANGEFCYMCNCLNCFNNLENEDHRNRAIKACLERNPHAFRPKIGKAKDPSGELAVRKHTKGCNCKRSGCLKNYCECYEAKIACSNNCKCIGCRNIEDAMEKKTLRTIFPNVRKSMDPSITPEILYRTRMVPYKDELKPRRSLNSRKQTINFITEDVIEATCQCLLTISDNADTTMQDEELTKRQIIEEFGRCLTEIISCSSNRSVS